MDYNTIFKFHKISVTFIKYTKIQKKICMTTLNFIFILVLLPMDSLHETYYRSFITGKKILQEVISPKIKIYRDAYTLT